MIARAPSVPGIHTTRTAFAFWEISRISSGRPQNNTTATWPFTSQTLRNSSIWIFGICIVALLVASPDCSLCSPSASTTVSASFASFTASASILSHSSAEGSSSTDSVNPSSFSSPPSSGHPDANRAVSPSSRSCMASLRVVTSFVSPTTDQEPIIFRLST